MHILWHFLCCSFFSSELLQLYVMPLSGLCTLHFNQAASYMAFTRQHWSRESIISLCFAAVATAWYVRAVFTSFILRARPGDILIIIIIKNILILLFLPSKYNQLTVHRMNWSFKWSLEIKLKIALCMKVQLTHYKHTVYCFICPGLGYTTALPEMLIRTASQD